MHCGTSVHFCGDGCSGSTAMSSGQLASSSSPNLSVTRYGPLSRVTKLTVRTNCTHAAAAAAAANQKRKKKKTRGLNQIVMNERKNIPVQSLSQPAETKTNARTNMNE